jgi:hypothetical protein
VVAAPGDLAPDGSALGADDWWIEGDRPEASTDSRRFGPISRRLIRSRATAIYAPSSRRRRL